MIILGKEREYIRPFKILIWTTNIIKDRGTGIVNCHPPALTIGTSHNHTATNVFDENIAGFHFNISILRDTHSFRPERLACVRRLEPDV